MSIFASIKAKLSAMKQKAANKEGFVNLLINSARDGSLNENEMKQLATQLRDYGLSVEDIKKATITAYLEAFRAVKSDGKVTKKEEEDLNNIKHFLKLSDQDVGNTQKELRKLRVIAEIEQGNLPIFSVDDLAHKKNEKIHWIENATLIEERVVRRSYQGGSRGKNVRIMKGVSFRVGAQRGKLVMEKEFVPVSNGELLVTNQRLIFRGDTKTFNIKMEKLIDYEIYRDGIRISAETGKPRFLTFNHEEHFEIIGLIITKVINANQ